MKAKPLRVSLLILYLPPYGILLPLVAFYGVVCKQWSPYLFIFRVAAFVLWSPWPAPLQQNASAETVVLVYAFFCSQLQ